MVNKLKHMAGSWPAFVGGALWLLYFTVSSFWPSSWWFDVRSVRVADAFVGEQVVMYVDREIKREFSGRWSAAVRDVGTGTYAVVCAAGDESVYRMGAELPANLTLGWWTNGRCETLPEGEYVVDTVWRIDTGFFVGDKTIRATSNIFKVRA